jgi:hypothetical protein
MPQRHSVLVLVIALAALLPFLPPTQPGPQACERRPSRADCGAVFQTVHSGFGRCHSRALRKQVVDFSPSPAWTRRASHDVCDGFGAGLAPPV